MKPSNAVSRRVLILVVDDDRDAREMLSEYLTFCGFNVQRAQDGSEAIDTALRLHPCVVLMDLMMPRMDGWEATRRLKADARTRGIAVVAVSACSSTDERVRAWRAGCTEFVPKPVDLEEISTIVSRLVDSSSSTT